MKFIRSEYSLVVLLLLFVAIVYFPALDSRLLLDDFHNLAGLESIDTKGYFHFIFSGFAGPSGRPVTLSTFALQYEQWPHNPFAFKLVNLIIHLLNGVLVYVISRLLFTSTGLEQRYIIAFALMVSTLWIMQPIHISAVMYVVQRMTLLATFFSLSAVLAYLRLWRPGHHEFESFKRLMAFSLLFGSCLVLAVFSKETGVLMPLLILVIEFTLLGHIKRPLIWKKWAVLFLVLPLVLVVMYIAYNFSNTIASYYLRPFTMTERLLSEARILFIYLNNIILPQPAAFSLYHDTFPVSRGLLSPPTTFIAIIGILIMILASLIYRLKWPVFSFAVLWFLGAHLLESTYLNLELYFEHRNYLAAYGVCLLLSWICLKVFSFVKIKMFGFLLSLAVISPPVAVSLLELNQWSMPPLQQITEWQKRSPDSPRAMTDLTNQYLLHGDMDKVRETLYFIRSKFPLEIYPYLKGLSIKSCMEKREIEQHEWEQLLEQATTTRWHGFATIQELDTLTINIKNGKCESINIYLLIRLILILSVNPEYANNRAPLHELAALLNAYIGEIEAALNNVRQMLVLTPTPSRHILKIEMLLEYGHLEEAEAAITNFKQILRKRPRLFMAYKEMLADLETGLVELKLRNSPYRLQD